MLILADYYTLNMKKNKQLYCFYSEFELFLVRERKEID